jgi:hypothetical protein
VLIGAANPKTLATAFKTGKDDFDVRVGHARYISTAQTPLPAPVVAPLGPFEAMSGLATPTSGNSESSDERSLEQPSRPFKQYAEAKSD